MHLLTEVFEALDLLALDEILVFEPLLPLGDHSLLLDAMVAFERPQEASFELLDVIEAVEKVVVVAK